MAQFFQFEADFVDSLRCIPMQMRLKLDLAGVKLQLSHWNHLSPAARQQLVEAPYITTAELQNFKTLIYQLIEEQGGDRPNSLPIDPTPAWENLTQIPETVQQQARSYNLDLSLDQWAHLSSLQRFALIKLSRSNHENKNFLPALQEFQLIPWIPAVCKVNKFSGIRVHSAGGSVCCKACEASLAANTP